MTVVARLLSALLLAGFVLPSLSAAQGAAVPEVRFTVTRFTVTGDNPLSNEATGRVLAGYTGEYSGLDGLLAAADALEQALAAAGHGFHRVSLPPQTLDGGEVRLHVVQFRLGQVQVEGVQHFSADGVRASLPMLRPGTPPHTERIARGVAVANRHPSKTLAVSMRQGEAPDTVDAVVKVRERRPWSVFALLNNTGTTQTGRSRLSVGAQHANLFGRDHVLTASGTTSPQNFGGVRQYGVSYQVPFYAASGWLTLSWVHSSVDTGQVAQFFDVSGSGTFWGANWRQELARRGALRQAWSISLQDRRFDNDVRFLGAPLGSVVRSRPLQLRWDGEYVRQAGNLRAYAAYVHNLWGGSNNDDTDYAAARAGAKRDWNVLRAGVEASQALGAGWHAQARADAQWAGEALIPGEQLGLGGAHSIRGFEERAVAADNGVVASLELWAPAIARAPGLRLLGFVDAGYKDLERPLPGEDANDWLASAGVGARYTWRDNLSATLDYGRVLNHARGTASDAGNSRWHLSVLYRY